VTSTNQGLYLKLFDLNGTSDSVIYSDIVRVISLRIFDTTLPQRGTSP